MIARTLLSVDFLTFLASEAHSRGMSIGLKNGGDIIGAVIDKRINIIRVNTIAALLLRHIQPRAHDRANAARLDIDFLTFLASEAHSRGMSIGLKNGGDIIGAVIDKMRYQTQ
jgi:hypothetical protein